MPKGLIPMPKDSVERIQNAEREAAEQKKQLALKIKDEQSQAQKDARDAAEKAAEDADAYYRVEVKTAQSKADKLVEARKTEALARAEKTGAAADANMDEAVKAILKSII